MAAGSLGLALLPPLFGIAGYVAGLAVLTPSYQLFQAANNTAVMATVPADRRGAVSGLLNLARNLGLVTGASAMGTLFALAAGANDVALARPESVAAGMQWTFLAAALLVLAGLALNARGPGATASPAAPPAGSPRSW